MRIAVTLTASGKTTRSFRTRVITEPTSEMVHHLAEVLSDYRPYLGEGPPEIQAKRMTVTLTLVDHHPSDPSGIAW